MDYKELIELSQKAASEWRTDHTFYQAGVLIDSLCSAIEALLAERDAAVSDIEKRCETCKHFLIYHNGCTPDYDCDNPECRDSTGNSGWEWRGPQKGEPHGE